ncbi:MAG: ATP-binding protein [Magnetococcales bacterium]|nr:ATP-binding protein [Magnetococcales bacterium]
MAEVRVAPGEGERRAQRGYVRQYKSSAAAIYAALDRNDLLWVGLADRTAGIADDVVLGFADRVVGHQFKTSQFPETFTLRTLLMGKDGLLKPLVAAWQSLKSAHPNQTIEIHLVTNDIPSTNVKVGSNPADHSAAFLAEFEQHPRRTLDEWRATRWWNFMDELRQSSGLAEQDFEQFWLGFRLLHGSAADFVQLHRLTPEGARLSEEIAKLLPRLVADSRNKDRWSRAELLNALDWSDSFISRHPHLFPVGAHVQRNVETEKALLQAISKFVNGYIALVGQPGTGKSTLLQTSLATESNLRVIRYLAYVPGTGQGIGRGEADDFLDDIASQLKNTGLQGVRFRNNTRSERMEDFYALLGQAGNRYQQDQIRTLIVVDGLDHVPREENPQHSFLAELPLPASIPDGVLFVLGTQRLDLNDLKSSVRDQADADGRKVVVSLLKREAVHRMANCLNLVGRQS